MCCTMRRFRPACPPVASASSSPPIAPRPTCSWACAAWSTSLCRAAVRALSPIASIARRFPLSRRERATAMCTSIPRPTSIWRETSLSTPSAAATACATPARRCSSTSPWPSVSCPSCSACSPTRACASTAMNLHARPRLLPVKSGYRPMPRCRSSALPSRIGKRNTFRPTWPCAALAAPSRPLPISTVTARCIPRPSSPIQSLPKARLPSSGSSTKWMRPQCM